MHDMCQSLVHPGAVLQYNLASLWLCTYFSDRLLAACGAQPSSKLVAHCRLLKSQMRSSQSVNKPTFSSWMALCGRTVIVQSECKKQLQLGLIPMAWAHSKLLPAHSVFPVSFLHHGPLAVFNVTIAVTFLRL